MGFLDFPQPKHPFERAKELHDMIELVQKVHFDFSSIPMVNHSDKVLPEIYLPGALIKDIDKFEFPKEK